jgi:zinc/manganese transport system permease protein
MISFLLNPFIEFGFMQRALIACLAISLSGCVIGCLLVLRKMTLVGDAMSHSILPGVSVAFLITGISIIPMTIGGILAGLLVAIISAMVSKSTGLKEDSSFTATHLLCLSGGIILIAINGSSVDLMHVLFGNVLAVDNKTLILVGVISSVSILTVAIFYRQLVVECFDANFLNSIGKNSSFYHQIFMVLLVLNLVAGFNALGTLMALGILILPAIVASFWANQIDSMVVIAFFVAVASSFLGLVSSYYISIPTGPSIVFTTGIFYVISVMFGKNSGFLNKYIFKKHLTN